MKFSHTLCVLGVAAVLVSGCGTATTADSPAVAPQTAAQRDLLTLLPDAASFPSYLAPSDSDTRILTLEAAAKSASAWNGFGTLIPAGEYQPAGCTPTRTPDMAPYASGSFAWKYHFFADTSKKSLPTQAVLVGATIGRGEVDEAQARTLAAECAIVRTSEGVSARYEVLSNPKADSAQVLAIKTEVGLKGGIFRLTYVAQVGEYIVTTYALCTTVAVCEKEAVPVFQNGVVKAGSA